MQMQSFIGSKWSTNSERVQPDKMRYALPVQGTLHGDGAMPDQLSAKAVLYLFITTLIQVFFAVVCITMALCESVSCGGRVVCAIVGMASGGTLFTRIVCVQLGRFYRGGLGREV